MQVVAPEILNRMEELDILILDHHGNPVAFTKNFSSYIDSSYLDPEIDLKKYYRTTFPSVIRKYLKGKLNKGENLRLYCKIIIQILEYISFNYKSCEEFRVDRIKRLNL
jgi:hypothetical protein